MSEEFIIFQARVSKQKGDVLVAQPKKEQLFRFPKKFYSYLIALPIIILLYVVSPLIIGEIRYHLVVKKPPEVVQSKFRYILSPNDNEMELIIPKIAVRTKVLVNIDPSQEKEYNTILSNKAAHALGSSLPGQKGLIYLFGHSTNSIFNLDFFNPVFYSVKNLEKGDQIAILYQGKVYNYGITEKKIVEADDLSDLKAGLNEEKLILQTCWPPGTSWKRLLLIANPIT
ncbi:sortase [Patescibacteria group bacterium]|nr:sortase [Patescibacteria group bacterium]